METSIRDFYDRRGKAALSGQESVPFYLLAPYTFASHQLQKFPKNSKFLDLCCGTGVHSVLPAKLGFRVFGVDISPKSVEAARALAQSENVQCEFSVSDAKTYMAETGPFDTIFVSGSLYYFDRKDIIQAIREALVSGGNFVAIETNGSNFLMNVIRKLKSLFLKHRDSQTLGQLIRIRELRTLSDGFSDWSVRYFDFFTLLTPLWSWSRWTRNGYYRVALQLDDWLLNGLGLRFLAFKFVVVGKKQ